MRGTWPSWCRAARAAIFVVGIGTAACSGSLLQSKAVPPSTYLLSVRPEPGSATAAPAAVPASVAADLAVLKPRVRAGLDTDRIAVLYPDRRLDYFADARWSGPVDDMVQDLAVQAFRAGARLQNVSTDASAFASGYWLEIEVADFQAEYPSSGGPPTVNVQLLARVASAGSRDVLGSFSAGARETATDNRLTAIIDAYEHATNTALAGIVGNTTRKLTETLEHR